MLAMFFISLQEGLQKRNSQNMISISIPLHQKPSPESPWKWSATLSRGLPWLAALVVKNPSASAGDLRDMGLIPRSGSFPEGGHGKPVQYPCLENPMDRGAWWATVHGFTQNQTQLSNWGLYVYEPQLNLERPWSQSSRKDPQVSLSLASQKALQGHRHLLDTTSDKDSWENPQGRKSHCERSCLWGSWRAIVNHCSGRKGSSRKLGRFRVSLSAVAGRVGREHRSSCVPRSPCQWQLRSCCQDPGLCLERAWPPRRPRDWHQQWAISSLWLLPSTGIYHGAHSPGYSSLQTGIYCSPNFPAATCTDPPGWLDKQKVGLHLSMQPHQLSLQGLEKREWVLLHF